MTIQQYKFIDETQEDTPVFVVLSSSNEIIRRERTLAALSEVRKFLKENAQRRVTLILSGGLGDNEKGSEAEQIQTFINSILNENRARVEIILEKESSTTEEGFENMKKMGVDIQNATVITSASHAYRIKNMFPNENIKVISAEGILKSIARLGKRKHYMSLETLNSIKRKAVSWGYEILRPLALKFPGIKNFGKKIMKKV